MCTLAAKNTAKAARGTQKDTREVRMGCKRVREAKPQVLRLEFDQMCFKIGECIEDFVVLLASIVKDNLELLEDPVDKYKCEF
jgi:hypothetical protein